MSFVSGTPRAAGAVRAAVVLALACAAVVATPAPGTTSRATGSGSLVLPHVSGMPGETIAVPIRATHDSVFTVDLYFVADRRFLEPVSPLVKSHHLYSPYGGPWISEQVSGDTIGIIAVSVSPHRFSGQTVIEIALRIRIDAPLGTVIPLAWLANRSLINMDTPSLTNGSIRVGTAPTVIEATAMRAFPGGVAPPSIVLGPNAPNPFNASTRIRFVLTRADAVDLFIGDASGRSVRRIAIPWLDAGPHEVPWDGRDDAGRAVGSGVYLCRVATRSASATAPLSLVR